MLYLLRKKSLRNYDPELMEQVRSCEKRIEEREAKEKLANKLETNKVKPVRTEKWRKKHILIITWNINEIKDRWKRSDKSVNSSR